MHFQGHVNFLKDEIIDQYCRLAAQLQERLKNQLENIESIQIRARDKPYVVHTRGEREIKK